ncbi:5083_t:CDS:10 [Ambispora gerdemannii]|uniref:Serine/threonine-protein kinase n=1 Tax=Ambispora gerdemannii TaxID=144530 RepID=A0A9N9D3K1_9GLOM|nr:5083_t:CDS:10 [Ambispora gerdemannii]
MTDRIRNSTTNQPHHTNEPPVQIKARKTRQEYTRRGLLGEGGFAKCYAVVDLKENLYAAKVVWKESLSKNPKNKPKLLSEIKIHKLMDHPNIVRFHEAFEDDAFVYLILEHCPNKTLLEMNKFRKRLTEPEVRFFLCQILDACRYMHRASVIHRDLKLANLLLSEDMKVKIGDFGLATQLQDASERKKTICGTPNYIAPEVLFDKTGHSYEVDIWSVGVIVYTLLFGKPPFQTKGNVEDIYRKIKEHKYDFPSNISVSSDAKDLINYMLTQQPASAQHRPSAKPFLLQRLHANKTTNVCTTNKTGFRSNTDSSPAGCITRQPKQASTDDNWTKRFIATLKTINHKKTTNICTTNKTGFRSNTDSSPAAFKTHQHSAIGAAYDTIERAFAESKLEKFQIPSPLSSSEAPAPPAVFITKWIDYSTKFGIGYELTDGSVGMYLNDKSTLVLSPDELHFEFISTRLKRSLHTLKDYPSSLAKKVGLLNNFKSALAKPMFKSYPYSCVDKNRTDGMIFLTKYTKTAHGILFRLSNRVVQVNFYDHHKFLLSDDGRVVTWINSDQEMKTLHVNNEIFSGQYPVIVSRLKYIREILKRMLAGRENNDNSKKSSE